MDFNKISQAIDSGSLLGNQTPTYNYEQTLHQQKQYNPNNYRQNQLLAATERNRERLGGLQEELDHNINEWRKAGFSEELIQEEANKFIKLRSMSSQERLDNVIRFQNNDPSAVEDIELAQDIATKDTAFLEGKYGKAVASFAYEKSQQDMQNLNILSGKKSFDFFSWDNAKDMGVSVLRKGVDTVNSMGNAIDLAINGEDAVERIANREGLLDNLSDEINSWHTHEFDRATKRNEVRDSIRDEVENQRAIDYLAQGYTNNRARSKANTDRQLEQIGDVFEEGSTLSAQSAELGADLLIGGAVAKGAQLVGKGAGKLAGKFIENQAKKNIAKAGAKLADKAEPKLQAAFSGEKTASQLAQARLAGDKVNNTLGKASPHQINGKATIIDKGDEHIYNGTLLGSKIKSEAKNTATQVGNAIEKSRDSVINYQKAQIAQKFTDKSQRLLNTVKKDIDELVTNAGKITAGIGVTAHGSNQEAIEAIGSTYNQMMSIEPDKLYATTKGKEIIDSLVQEKGFTSFEEAKKDKSFMEALYEKQSSLAKTASISAYKEVFKDSALVNALSSRAELAVGGVTDKVKGFKKHLTDFAFKTLGESAEEFVEGYSGEYHPKDEINKALQSTVFDPTKQAAAIGAQGAIVAALGTSGINALPLGAKTAKKGIEKGLETVADKQQTKLNQESDNEVNRLYGNPTTDTRSTIEKVKDKVTGNTVESEPVVSVFGKKFSETNFGQAWKTIDTSVHPSVKKAMDESEGSYTTAVLNMKIRLEELRDEWQQTQDTDKRNEIKQEALLIKGELDKLKLGMQKDITSSNPVLAQKFDEYTKAIQANDQEAIDRLGLEIDNLESNDEKISKLYDSTFYKLLNDQPITKDEAQRLDTEAIMGNPNFSVSYQDVVKTSNAKLDSIEKAVNSGQKINSKGLKSNLVTIFSEFSASNQKHNPHPKQVLKDAENLINRAELLIAKSDSKSLRPILNQFKQVIAHAKQNPQMNQNVFREIYFGAMKNGKYSFGLMDYLIDSIKNDGHLSPHMKSNLTKFNLSQLTKLQGVNQAIEHFKTSKEPIELLNDNLRNKSKYTKSLDGQNVTFKSQKAAITYKKRIEADAKMFNTITKALLTNNLGDIDGTVIDPNVPSGASSKNFKAKSVKELLDNHVPTTKEEFDSVRDMLIEDVMQLGNMSRALAERYVNTKFKDISKNPKKHSNIINVWYGSNENRNFSNLAKRKFTYEGREYQSVEHAYQSLKSGSFDEDTYNKSEWKKEGTKIKGTKGTDKSINRDLMKALVKASFEQNKHKEFLLATGSKKFTHSSPDGKTDYWTEEFPKILEEVRDELRKDVEDEKQKNSHPVIKRVFSGGAYGADNIWSQLAEESGVATDNITHYTIGTNKSGSRGKKENVENTISKKLTDLFKHVNGLENSTNTPRGNLKQFVETAKSILRTKKDYAWKLHARNVLQVINADSVFAVMPIEKNGVLGNSGTSTAVRLGLSKGIPVYVLDTNTNQWMTLQKGKWKPIKELPKLTSSPALVGTRGLESYQKKNKNTGKYYMTKRLDNADELIESMRAVLNQGVKADSETTNTKKPKVKVAENSTGTFADSSMSLATRIEVSHPYIGDIVAQAFDEFSDKWSGNDLTELDSEETNTTFEVNTTEGVKQYSIPMSAMVEMHRKGFDPTVNLAQLVTTEQPVDIVTQNYESTLSESDNELLDIFGLEHTEANLKYVTAFQHNLNQVNEFFEDSTPVVLNQDYKGKLSKFTLVNGMLNFISIEEGENGEPKTVIPNEVKVAFAKAISLVQSDSSSLSFGKHKQYEDYFFEDLKGTDVTIYKATNVERFGAGFNSKKLGVENVQREEVELSNYSELGVTRNDFIELLGKHVFDNLPMKLDKNSPYYSEDIYNGLIHSLGIEAFNIMLQQELIEIHHADVVTDNDTKTIPYVNFKSNISENLSEQERLAYESVSSGLDLDGMSLEQANTYLAKNNLELLTQAELVLNKSDEINEVLYPNTESHNSGVFISSLSGKVGKKYQNRTNTVRPSDTKNDITKTNNEKLTKAIGSKNTVTFALNQEYYALLKSNPEALQLAFGYTPDVDILPVTEATKKAIRSKNNGILRAIGLLQRFVAEAEAKGIEPNDIAFNFSHHFVTNMRTMLKADMNPQSDKIIREMLRLVQSEVNQEDGTITGEMKLEVDLGTKNSKFRTDGSPRTLEQLIQVAQGKKKSQPKTFAIGLILALMQGLDLGKIEKTTNENIFKELPNLLEPDSLRMKVMDIVWKMQLGTEQNNPYTLTKEENQLMSEFGQELGTAAPRALYALQTLANYMYRGTNNDPLARKRGRNHYKTNLLLEADGIGNGLFNITKQFALSFTPAYINTLKRTGIIPLDVLAQKYLVGKVKKDKLVESLQGSAGMFTADSEDTKGLRDIYEVIADKLSQEANQALHRILSSEYAKGKTALTWKDFKKKLNSNDKNAQLINDIKLLSQLALTGHIKLSDDMNLGEIIFNPSDVVISENFLIEVKRNLSKAGVTPTVYGGQLEGIANQLTGDLKGNIIKLGDEIINLSNEYDKNPSKDLAKKIEDKFNTLKQYYSIFGISVTNSIEIDDSSEGTITADVAEIVNKTIYQYQVNSKQIKFSLKQGLAKSLQRAVQDTYVDEFAMLNYSMAQDDVGFHNFIVEFEDKVKSKIAERNKAKGYEVNDPRNHSPLTKQEIREVIKTITSAPIIATAFANEAELFEDVWELGNSLVKRGRHTLEEQTTLNSSYVSVQQGNYQRNLTTQLFRNYQRYTSAGASNATSTVPSTESATQAGLAEELLDTLSGITSLDVFDGIDGLLYFRDLLGQTANRITNQVHQDTNLVKHFYNRFIKSGMVNLPNTNKLSPKFRDIINNTNLENLLTFTLKDLNLHDIGYLLGVFTLAQMNLESSKLNPEYHRNPVEKEKKLEAIKKINAIKSKLTELRDGLLYNPKTTKNELVLDNILDNNLNSTIQEAFSDKYKDSNGKLVYPNIGYSFSYSMNKLIQDFVYKVAQGEALRHIEKTYLPSIINQFAGANRGYLFNEEQLDSVGKRFLKFAISKHGSNIAKVDFKSDSSTLAEFLATDSEIQKEYKKKLENTLKKLDIPSVESIYLNKNANESKEEFVNRQHSNEYLASDKVNSRIYTIDEFIDEFNYLADNTLEGKVFKVLSHNIKKLYGDNFRISYDANELAEFLISKGVSKDYAYNIRDSFLKNKSAGISLNDVSLGTSIPFNIIYLNPNTKTKGGYLRQLLNHEMTHANINHIVQYMSDNETRNKLKESNPSLDASANRLTKIIQSMVNNAKHLKEFNELLDLYRSNPSEFYHYNKLVDRKYNQVIVGLANYTFLSEMNPNALPTGWSTNDYVSAMSGTLHELLAFSLGNSDTLLELANRKEDKSYSLWEAIKDLFSKARDELLNILGLKDKELKNSNLTGILESILQANDTLTSDRYELQVSNNNYWYNAHTYKTNDTTGLKGESNSSNSAQLFSSFNSNLENTFTANIDKVFNKVKNEFAYGEEARIIQKSYQDSELTDLVQKLRSKGLPMNQEEERVLKIAYAANMANFETGSNSDLLRETSKVIRDILNNSDLSSLPHEVQKLLFNNNFNQNALLLALFSTNEHLKGLAKVKDEETSKLKKSLKNLEDKLNDWTIFKDNKYIGSNVLEKLQHSSMLFSFRNKQSVQEKERRLQEEYAKEDALMRQNEWLDSFLAEVPNGVVKYLGASRDLLTGKDLFQDGSGADSSIGQLLRLIVRNNEKLYGRNTLFSKGMSWILGQDFSTQYSAKFKGESQQLTSVIRERLSSVIPHSLRKQFENDLSDRQEKALDNVLNVSELHRIANINIVGIKPQDLLTKQNYRDQALLEIWQDVQSELDKMFTGKQRQEAENFLRWQVQGLGELMVTRTAKSNSSKVSHEILPNSKAIASFAKTKFVLNQDNRNLMLEEKIGQLASLYSLNHQNQNDLNIIADLFKNESDGMKALVDTLNSLERERVVHGQNLLGEDGYRYNKRNPNQDVKIIEPSDNTRKRDLIKFGYKHQATLPSGSEVWVTNDNINNRFTTGIFGLTDSTVKGVSLDGMTTLGSFTGDHYETKSYHLDKALKDPNYYDKLKESSSIKQTISADGKSAISEVEELPRYLENQLITTYENGIDALGNAKGRTMEELATEQNNIYYIEQLNKHYHKSFDKSKFTKIDGEFKPKGKSQADIEFANRLNNIYNSFPDKTKEFIAKEGGLYIETSELDNLLGYHKASITDIWTDKSGLPKLAQESIKASLKIFSTFTGISEPILAKRSERLLTEVVSVGKDFILNRSGVVALGNMVSNLIHLWNTGVPLKQTPNLIKEGLQNIKQYNKDLNRLAELHHLNDIEKNPNKKLRISSEIKILQEAIDKNPVKPLVDEGILTSITLENKRDEKEFDYIPQFQKKLGFDRFKETKIGKVWGNIAVQDGSTTHEFMEQALDLGDFVAKYALYTHLTKNRQFKPERALNVIRDEFVNYGYNRGRVFDFLNQTGLTWFLSYKLGIQKIFFRNLRRNFLRTSAVYTGAKAIGTNQVVPLQNLLLDGSLGYQLDPSNIYKSFSSHWLSLLL